MARAASLVIGIVALALAAPARADGAFVDPLDLPSAPSPVSPKRLLTAVTFAGPRLVAAGQRGHLLWSDDRGRTWTQAEVPVSSDLTALAFPDPQHGWAVGHDGVVLVTADGGKTWTRQLDGRRISPLFSAAMTANGLPDSVREQISFLAQKGADLPLLDVWFDDEKSGFVIGAFNLILHTADGGLTWVPWLDRIENPKALHLYGVHRAGGALFIAGEQGLMLAAASGQVVSIADAGTTGSLIPETRALPTSSFVSDGSTLVMVGMLGVRLEKFHAGKEAKQ